MSVPASTNPECTCVLWMSQFASVCVFVCVCVCVHCESVITLPYTVDDNDDITGRCGGAAILLSNKVMDGYRAKYKLLHSIRTQNASEESLNCVVQTEDAEGRQCAACFVTMSLVFGCHGDDGR